MADPDLTFAEFTDVTFLPCRPTRASPTGYAFGVFGADGAPLAPFAHQWCALVPHEPAQLVLPGPAIYGGMLMSHFGHFLMEAMATLWFIEAHPELPIVWHWIDLPVAHTPWTGWLDETWRLLGLGARRHHVIHQPVRIDRVLLPQSGLPSRERLHPHQAAAMAKVGGVDESIGKRVWLSRRELPNQFGRIEGEDELEAILEDSGWRVERPQTRPVAHQARVFASADVVAGFAGSAFHAALLATQPRARSVVVHRPVVDYGYYRAVAEARGFSLAFCEVDLEPLGPSSAWTHYRLTDPRAAAQRVFAAASGSSHSPPPG